MKIKQVVQIILIILLAIFVGTIIDYIIHGLSPRFSVPASYFQHKLFYGTLWAILAFFIARRFTKNWLDLSFIASFASAAVLQTIYFLRLHLAVDVVLLFLILHFFMFLAPMALLFWRYKNLIEQK